MRSRVPKKMLVILPPEDVRIIEEQVLQGKYVTKSDFFRIAVKRLIQEERMIVASEITNSQFQKSQTRLTADKILKTLKENKAKIRQFGVKEIGLFGSYASNEQTAKSDIDILVTFSKANKNFHNYMQLKLLLERLFNRKVDLVIKDSIRSELRKSILNGVVYA